MYDSLVTIIVPMFNCEDRILRCVQSILGQTYRNIEVIVINDGSTDNSLKVLQNGFSDPRLKIYNQENHGVSYTRNRGIEIALSNDTNGWITFVDADDYIDVNTLYDCLNFEDSNSVDLIHYGFRRTDEDDIETHCFCDNKERIVDRYEALQNVMKGRLGHKYVNGNWLIHVTSALFRKQIIYKEALRFDTSISMGEDGIFSIRYLNYVDKIRMLNKAYYTWWHKSNSLSSINGEIIISRIARECSIIWPMMYNQIVEFGHDLDSLYAEWIVSYWGFILNNSAKVNLSWNGVKKYYKGLFAQEKELQYVYNHKYSSFHEKFSRLMLKSKSNSIAFVVIKLMRIVNRY